MNTEDQRCPGGGLVAEEELIYSHGFGADPYKPPDITVSHPHIRSLTTENSVS